MELGNLWGGTYRWPMGAPKFPEYCESALVNPSLQSSAVVQADNQQMSLFTPHQLLQGHESFLWGAVLLLPQKQRRSYTRVKKEENFARLLCINLLHYLLRSGGLRYFWPFYGIIMTLNQTVWGFRNGWPTCQWLFRQWTLWNDCALSSTTKSNYKHEDYHCQK